MLRPVVPYLSVVLALLMFGCSSEATVAPNQTGEQQTESSEDSFSHVIAVEVEYYTTGPQQGRPPDGKFPAGTKVNIIHEAGSYTQVRSEDGVEAFVTSDAIKEIDP